MKLTIAEGLYLIAMDDEEGRLLSAADKRIIPGVISAIFLELCITRKITLEEGLVKVTNTQGSGNKILDDIARKVVPGKDVVTQIEHLSHHSKDILADLDELLSQRGILKREATKLLWIPLSERMGNANYAYEKEIRNILHAMVFKKAKPTPAFVVLMSLIHDCNILDEVFRDKDELIDAEKVAKDITDSTAVDPDTSKALHELRAYFEKLP